MMTILARKKAATDRRERSPSDMSLVEQKKRIEKATKRTVGLASRAYRRKLEEELRKLDLANAV